MLLTSGGSSCLTSMQPLTKEKPWIVIHNSITMLRRTFLSSSPKSAVAIHQCKPTSEVICLIFTLFLPCERLWILAFLSCRHTTSSIAWNIMKVASLICHSPPLSTEFNQLLDITVSLSSSSSSSPSNSSIMPKTSSSFSG